MASAQLCALWCLQRPDGLLPKGFGLSTARLMCLLASPGSCPTLLPSKVLENLWGQDAEAA